jgi:hypothetical protein
VARVGSSGRPSPPLRRAMTLMAKRPELQPCAVKATPQETCANGDLLRCRATGASPGTGGIRPQQGGGSRPAALVCASLLCRVPGRPSSLRSTLVAPALLLLPKDLPAPGYFLRGGVDSNDLEMPQLGVGWREPAHRPHRASSDALRRNRHGAHDVERGDGQCRATGSDPPGTVGGPFPTGSEVARPIQFAHPAGARDPAARLSKGVRGHHVAARIARTFDAGRRGPKRERDWPRARLAALSLKRARGRRICCAAAPPPSF